MSGISITHRKQIPNAIPPPPEHQHNGDTPFPVICYDFNETLTPAIYYPIEKKPYPKVKRWLKTFADMGACNHITTSGLYFHGYDLPIYIARQKMLRQYCNEQELAIMAIGGKVPADVFLADNTINVPKGDPDWDDLADQIMDVLSNNWDVKDGKFVRNDRAETGTLITQWPSASDLKPDEPRGFSSARINIDFHRTLLQSSSSTRMGPLMPGAKQVVNALYDAGFTVRLDCAGWNPQTHSPGEAGDRYNGLRWQAQKEGVKYDRVITKDYGQCYVDDKGVRFTNWKDIGPQVMKLMQDSGKDVPDLQWPA